MLFSPLSTQHSNMNAWKQVWACDPVQWDLHSNGELHFIDLTMGAKAPLCQSTAHWWMECFEQLRSPEKEGGRRDRMCCLLWDLVQHQQSHNRGQESTFQCGIFLCLSFCLRPFELHYSQLSPPLYLFFSKSFCSWVWLQEVAQIKNDYLLLQECREILRSCIWGVHIPLFWLSVRPSIIRWYICAISVGQSGISLFPCDLNWLCCLETCKE